MIPRLGNQAAWLPGATLGLTLCCNLLCAGFIYGWVPLQVMLDDAGAFQEGCSSDCSTGHSLTLVYALAAGALEFGGFFSGIVLDRIGPAHLLLWLTMSMTAALAMIAAFPLVGSWVLFPGFILAGCTGVSLFMVTVVGAGLVQPRYVNYVIITATCTFDGSLAVGLLLNFLYSRFGSFPAVFGAYAAASGSLMALATLGWYRCTTLNLVGNQRTNEEREPSPVPIISKEPNEEEASVTEGFSLDSSVASGAEIVRRNAPMAEAELSEPAVEQKTATDLQIQEHECAEQGAIRRPRAARAAPLSELPLRRQVLSQEYLLFTCFYVTCVLKANGYVGYLDAYLVDIGAPADDFYQQLLGGLLALSFVWVPLVEAVIGRAGIGWSAQAGNAVSVCYILFLMTEKLWAQWPAVILNGLFRTFVFGFPPMLALEVFGPKTFGRMSGLLYTMGGFPTLLAYPLTTWGSSGKAGGWMGVHAFLLATTVLGVLPIAYLQLRSPEAAFRPRANNVTDAEAEAQSKVCLTTSGGPCCGGDGVNAGTSAPIGRHDVAGCAQSKTSNA